MSSPSKIDTFFARYPSAKEAYAATKLYHLTHNRYLPDIQANGLRPNPDLFPAEHGAFLLNMYHRYASGNPMDQEYIQNRILDHRNIYLSTERPDMNGRLGYGVPERLVLLMRGMNALATKDSLTPKERAFARQAFEEHRLALTVEDSAIVALEVDPCAPSVIDSRLGRLALERVEDAEMAVDVAKYVDGAYSTNIPVEGTIAPEFISVFGQVPISPTRALLSVDTEPSWASSIH